MLRGEDPHLDLYSFSTKVELPTGARSQWKLTGDCTACHNRCIMIYECKCRYLQEQAPFRCKHNKHISTLKRTKDKDAEVIATPEEASNMIIRITDPTEAWERLKKRYRDKQLAAITAMRKLLRPRMPMGLPFPKIEMLVMTVRLARTRLRSVSQESQL